MSVGPTRFDYDEKNERFLFNERPPLELKGIDGPYVYGDTIVRVNHLSQLIKAPLMPNQTIPVFLDDSGHAEFQVFLKEERTSDSCTFPMPDNLIAISDIEGNFNTFSGFLIANKIIDENYNWIFKNGHLVLNGDFTDRGNQVTQVLWLIYKLEQEAIASGGKVHFILGNHEIMNMQGDFRYAKDKYKQLSNLLAKSARDNKTYRYLFNSTSVLGQWLRNKPVIIKIGDYLFTHAGLSPEFLKHPLSLKVINQIAQTNIDNIHNSTHNEEVNLICGKHSPYWYRGLVQGYKYYEKIKPDELKQLLQHYNAQSICIGHTVVDEVSTSFNGQVICIDVKHGKEKYSKNTQGLHIRNGKTYRINGKGSSFPI